MKKLMIFLTTLVMLGMNGLAVAQEPNPSHPIGGTAGASSLSAPSVVKIKHTWERVEGNLAYRTSVPSLGTVIGPHTILSHNHFDASMGNLPNESMVFIDNSGKSVSVRYADMKATPIDGGTMLFSLPGNLAVAAAPIANRSTIDSLTVGDWLTVHYWDDAAERFAQQDFQIIRIRNGIATLADPDRVINGGDSGGGAYFEGKLVGNNWSVNEDQNGNSLDSFNVALLPLQVADLVQ